ncbi:glycosyltransferase family 4 protein [Roseateles sp.]|uniref:glycosyltransferase family 4 protein n=1 Tax=Roseateles sp. TaxID=1971397 RepID=UPI003265E22C
MSALRVLQVSAFFPGHGGGIEAVAGALAARMPAAGVAMHWMAGGPREEWPASWPGVTVTAEPAWDPLERRLGLPFPVWSPAALMRLWRRVGEHDVVHAHDFLYLPTLAAMLFAALRGRPVVLTQHIGDIPFRSRRAHRLLTLLNRSLGAFVLRRVAQAVFVGLPVQRYFERFVRFRRPVCLVPNGVDHSLFHPPQTPPTGELRLLFVGRFVEKKGLRLLHHCLDLPGASWTFVGSGPLEPPAGPQLRLAGRLGPQQVADAFRTADLLVLPSTGEGFPLVVQEALASGTPVLVSTEVFEAFPGVDERCVFHVELRGATPEQALCERLQQLLGDPDRLRSARPAAAELARQWNWDATVQRYVDLYRDLAPAASHLLKSS